MNVFLGGQTVTFGNVISEMGKVSIVVLTGLSDQESNDSFISKLAPMNPDITTRIQKSLAYFRFVEMYVRP